MAITTRSALRQRVSEDLGDWPMIALSATSNGNGGGTTLIDTKLKNLPDGDDDDFVIGWYLHITSGTNDGETRRVKSYTETDTTITVESAYTGQILSGVTYELHRLPVENKHVAMSRAVERAFPFLYQSINDETLFVDDRLSNSDFESAVSGGAHPSWTNVNSPTVTGESTRVYHSKQAAKIVSHASTGAGQMTQAPDFNLFERAGQTAKFKRWVWSDTKDEARVRIDWDGSNFENSPYHVGDASWHLLEATGAVPTTATQAKCICEVIVGTKTAYFDGGGGAGLFLGTIHKYTVPTSIIRGPHSVLQQYDENHIEGPFYPVTTIPVEGRALRLQGMGLLSRPTTDMGTYEIAEPHISLLAAEACLILSRTPSFLRAAGQDVDRYRLDEEYWREEVARLRPQLEMRAMGAKVHPAWHPEEDADGRYIVFDTPR